MNDKKLSELVTAAVNLDRQIKLLTSELKGMKETLTTEAESRPEERAATDGGGWSWEGKGSDGCVARVTMPGPALKASIDGEGDAIDKVRVLAGSHFGRLFMQAPKYKLVAGFREEAESLLGRAAGKLVKLVTTKGRPQVAFETKNGEAGA